MRGAKVKNIFIVLLLLLTPLILNAKLTQTQNRLTVDYTVQSGDALYTIAHSHHTTVAEVLKANQLGIHAIIKAGQTLKVPLNTYFPEKKATTGNQKSASTVSAAKQEKASEKTVDYVIKNGDTFFTIARAHHTSIGALLKANNMDMDAVIKVGQHLSVPVNTYFPHQQTSKTTASSANPSTPPPLKSAMPSSSASSGTYIVRTGDTLFSIARINHIVISKLMQLNGIGLTDNLRIGQVLKISASSTFIPSQTPTTVSNPGKTAKRKTLPIGAMPSYTVKKGDTLWKIARKHHLTLAEIRKLNKMRKKDRIHTGMILAVGKAVQPKAKTYKVKKGDTLWLIAKKHNMSTKKLRQLNHMRRKDRIHTGMILALDKGVAVPREKRDSKTRAIIARLKKKGATKGEIEAVLAKVKRSKKKHPNILALLAQVKREKKKKQIETPLRIAKAKNRRKTRYSSAASILSTRTSGRSGWSSRNSRTIRVAKRYLGRRYVWGATGPSSFDCSGFTQYVMRKSKGVRLPRISRKQAYYGKYVSRRNLRAGDLVFFDTSRRRRGYVNHVGIYIGNNKFIHASSGRHRVVITSLSRPFYSARFKWGRRVN
jgi:LysM repeat protein